jgi:hypothetical protein
MPGQTDLQPGDSGDHKRQIKRWPFAHSQTLLNMLGVNADSCRDRFEPEIGTSPPQRIQKLAIVAAGGV